MSKILTITFEDNEYGLLLTCSPDVRDAMLAIIDDRPATTAEAVAGVTWLRLMQSVAETAKANPDSVHIGATKEEVTQAAADAECDSDCANCTHCAGNETRH